MRPSSPTLLLVSHSLVAAIYGTLIGRQLFVLGGSDWTAHVAFAERLLSGGQVQIVHTAFQWVIIAVALGSSAALPLAAWIVGIVSINVTFHLLYRWLKRTVRPTAAVLPALGLLIASPITLLTLGSLNYYFGYVGMNTFHNPTTIVLRPFALVLFGIVVHVLVTPAALSIRRVVGVISLIVISTFFKPVFALCLLPALSVIFVWRAWRQCLTRRFVLWAILINGTLLFTLGVQYLQQYTFIDAGNAKIILAPFESIRYFEPSVEWIIVKFFMSIAFPLSVTLLYRRQLSEAPAVQLAWLIFAFGAAQMVLLSETGIRATHGNFWWGAQVGLMVLFLASFEFFLRQQRRLTGWRHWVGWSIFMLHVISGLVYLALRISVPGLAIQ